MLVRLQEATTDLLVAAVFDHEVAEEASDPWYFGDVEFEVDGERQLQMIAEVFVDPPQHLGEYTAAQIEQGLWCMMGASKSHAFTGLIWNPNLPLPLRQRVIDSIDPLFDKLLAAYPYDEIDFRHPDDSERRYSTIDYMVPDLLLSSPWYGEPNAADQAAVRTSFVDLFERLLAHPAPVAQYAALHGLGHLNDPRGVAIIDRYMAALAMPERNELWYAAYARGGDVL